VARISLLWLNWRRVVIDTRGIGLGAKAMGMYLATFMNDDQHMAWPSLDRICHDLEIARATAVKHLASLESAGLLQKRPRFGQSTVYYARFPERVEEELAAVSSSRFELLDEHSSSQAELTVVQKLNSNSSLNSPCTENTDHICPSGSGPDFEQMWQAYPRKVGKKPARRLWEKLRKAERLAVLSDLGRRQWNPDPQYIPHPRTYLSQRRWEDEVGGAPVAVFGEDL